MGEKTKAVRMGTGRRNGKAVRTVAPAAAAGKDNGKGGRAAPQFGQVTPGPVVVPPKRKVTDGNIIQIPDMNGRTIGPWPDNTPPPPLDRKLADLWTVPQLLEVYRYMRMSREIENRVINLYRQGKISGGVFVGRGNEATAVAALYCLKPDDPVTILHRDLGAHLVRGWTCREIFMQYFARADSPNYGKDPGLHLGDLERYSLATVSPLGGMIPVTLGCALGLKMQGRDAVGLTFTGDGATSLGDFHEALNFASVWKAPFILIVENNQYAYSTPIGKQYACERISDRAEGYGMPGVTVDGTDALKMLATIRAAVERARRGEGPTLIESVTMRMRGHSEHDDASYVAKGQADMWANWDPIKRYEEFLRGSGYLNDGKIRSMIDEIEAAIDDGVAFAESQPPPSGPEAATGVYR